MKYPSVIVLTLVLAAAAAPSFALPGPLQGKDTPLKITSRPQASARGCSGSGKTVIKVSFDKSGQVTDAAAISSSGCRQFDQEALRAARKIIFEPATRKGTPITVIRPVEYTYAIY